MLLLAEIDSQPFFFPLSLSLSLSLSLYAMGYLLVKHHIHHFVDAFIQND